MADRRPVGARRSSPPRCALDEPDRWHRDLLWEVLELGEDLRPRACAGRVRRVRNRTSFRPRWRCDDAASTSRSGGRSPRLPPIRCRALSRSCPSSHLRGARPLLPERASSKPGVDGLNRRLDRRTSANPLSVGAQTETRERHQCRVPASASAFDATSRALQISRMRASANRPSRATSTATETLSQSPG